MPITDAERFVALLTSSDGRDRDRALRQRLTGGVWQRVSTERPELRRWLAFHPAVPEYLLRQLAADVDVEVRWAVAYSPQTPLPLLEKLSQDSDWRVRTGVAGNRRAPRRIVRTLLADPAPQVSRTAHAELRFDGVTGAGSPRTSRFDTTRWAAARCYRYWWTIAACATLVLAGLALRPVLPGEAGVGLVVMASAVTVVVTGLRLKVLWFRRRPRYTDVPQAMTYVRSMS